MVGIGLLVGDWSGGLITCLSSYLAQVPESLIGFSFVRANKWEVLVQSELLEKPTLIELPFVSGIAGLLRRYFGAIVDVEKEQWPNQCG